MLEILVRINASYWCFVRYLSFFTPPCAYPRTISIPLVMAEPCPYQYYDILTSQDLKWHWSYLTIWSYIPSPRGLVVVFKGRRHLLRLPFLKSQREVCKVGVWSTTLCWIWSASTCLLQRFFVSQLFTSGDDQNRWHKASLFGAQEQDRWVSLGWANVERSPPMGTSGWLQRASLQLEPICEVIEFL